MCSCCSMLSTPLAVIERENRIWFTESWRSRASRFRSSRRAISRRFSPSCTLSSVAEMCSAIASSTSPSAVAEASALGEVMSRMAEPCALICRKGTASITTRSVTGCSEQHEFVISCSSSEVNVAKRCPFAISLRRFLKESESSKGANSGVILAA
ncbi:hypothetical protein D3C78_1303510 [compost metagenome]